ncbi:MAG: gamma-glutamyl-gamma-aminobutyrate hydrolase family protein [Microbacteriaceae bacterium]|nr:gamma-glutamyl-gamma-aminobutyrate hydrolase family protein [Microbacteriaceae bacterium]
MTAPNGRQALVLQHENRINLGNFEPVLREYGYHIRIVDPTTEDVLALDPEAPEIVIVLGGEMGVYETQEHPYLVDEMDFIRDRVTAQEPIFGVCLGAQLMAGALGGRNYKGNKPDLGYQNIQLTEAGLASPVRHVNGVGMLEWHGDHFTLPEEAILLGSSSAYPNEAFAIGDFALAVQFHPEVTNSMHEEWTLESDELFAENNIDAGEWRALGRIHNPPMQAASRAMLSEWLDGVQKRH